MIQFEMERDQYTILVDEKVEGQITNRVKINKEGARLIWTAYKTMWKYTSQTIEQRERRGGIAYVSEINDYIKHKHLPKDFNWEDYIKEKDKS